MSRLKIVLDSVTTVAVAVAAVLLIWRLIEPVRPTTKANVPAVEEISAMDIDISDAHGMGSSSSAVVLIEFTDFECPFCARHATETFERIEENFIKPGKVAYHIRHFPLEQLHPSALAAATAVECAGAQGRFWGMHHLMFARRGSLAQANWNAFASDAGVASMNAFDDCMRDPRSASRIQRDQADGAKLGVMSTPTFFIGRRTSTRQARLTLRVEGAAPFSVFEDGLKRALSS
jgi:protein-disulfide isomerase